MRRILAAVAMAAGLAWAPAARAAECPIADAVTVPGAEKQMQACLDDLTTAGTQTNGHTDRSDWQGLAPNAQRNPSGVPGLQVDGYMPDTSTSNTTHDWDHDAQFVIRMPNDWNGKLVVTGAPGVRKQYAADPVIGDFVLSWGYAYASTDKGNNGTSFYADGGAPGDSGVEWNARVTELTIAAKETLRRRYGRGPERTYVTGLSQGGYLTRWQLENRPDLYDGGVDWEGTLWQAEAPNLFTYLAAALKHYPRYRAGGDQAAHDAMIAAGFAPGSEFLWDDHYGVYWDLTQRTYREEFDPGYDGDTEAGTPFCQSGTPACDADYDYAARQSIAGPAIRRIENTGIIGKPMITLHGTLDSLLPIAANADVYRRKVAAAGRLDRHRYWVIEHGNHVDGRYDVFPDRLKPLQPCWQVAFTAMTDWVEKGTEPPPDQFVPDDRRGANADVANVCAVARRGGGGPGAQPVAGAGPLGAPGAQ
ncbi:MAG TPA: tannase/feruloyl esterase family alpha/beta hydrolase, partial [Solirubrobacteraceae bacterium]